MHRVVGSLSWNRVLLCSQPAWWTGRWNLWGVLGAERRGVPGSKTIHADPGGRELVGSVTALEEQWGYGSSCEDWGLLGGGL